MIQGYPSTNQANRLCIMYTKLDATKANSAYICGWKGVSMENELWGFAQLEIAIICDLGSRIVFATSQYAYNGCAKVFYCIFVLIET